MSSAQHSSKLLSVACNMDEPESQNQSEAERPAKGPGMYIVVVKSRQGAALGRRRWRRAYSLERSR